MKNLILLSFCFALLFNCQDDEEVTLAIEEFDFSECLSPEADQDESKPTYKTDWYHEFQKGEINFKLDESENAAHPQYSVENGNTTVFIYRAIRFIPSYFSVQNDEKRLLFQIDPSLDTFNIETANDFSNSECTYGYCGNWISSKISTQDISGNISGSKISELEWKIICNVTAISRNGVEYNIEFDEIFSNKN